MGIMLMVLVSLKLTWKIASALKVLVMTTALDKLGDRLSDQERETLEGRIRHHLFEHQQCCGRFQM
jgi:hypothetical protein